MNIGYMNKTFSSEIREDETSLTDAPPPSETDISLSASDAGGFCSSIDGRFHRVGADHYHRGLTRLDPLEEPSLLSIGCKEVGYSERRFGWFGWFGLVWREVWLV